MGPLERLLSCAGNWTGTNTLRVDPNGPADESSSTFMIAPVHGGRFAHVDHTWSYHGKPQEGALLIGCESDDGPVTIHWIDTWHMGRKVMSLRGPIAGDGAIDVRGTYAAPPGPDWGWRIVIRADAPERIELKMFNIEPGGTEHLAVEAMYAPA
jgi:hypothetical protein